MRPSEATGIHLSRGDILETAVGVTRFVHLGRRAAGSAAPARPDLAKAASQPGSRRGGSSAKDLRAEYEQQRLALGEIGRASLVRIKRIHLVDR